MTWAPSTAIAQPHYNYHTPAYYPLLIFIYNLPGHLGSDDPRHDRARVHSNLDSQRLARVGILDLGLGGRSVIGDS